MRRGLFFVLMVVLVLRGLTGTAMAAGLLAPLAPAAAAHPAQGPVDHPHGDAVVVGLATAGDSAHHHGSHAGAADHPSDAAALCDGSTGACGTHEHHASTCSACNLCHSAMLATAAPLVRASHPRGHARPQASAPFHSAPAALTIKPPIA